MKTTVLLDAIVREVSVERGFTVERFSPSGEPHAAAVVDAVTAAFDRPDIDWEALAAKRAKVTVMMAGSNFMGAKAIFATEGSLFVGSKGGIAILPKGARKSGRVLNVDSVLDLVEGYGHIGAMQAKVDAVKAGLPEVTALTKADLLAVTGKVDADGHSPDVTLAVFGTWRMPDGDAAGAVWLISEYDAEYDIADGVLILPDGPWESEHGSVYGEQLLSGRFGKVAGFVPMTFAQALRLTGGSYEDAVAHVDPKVTA